MTAPSHGITPAAFQAHWTACLDKSRNEQEVVELVEGHDALTGFVIGPLTEAQREQARARVRELRKIAGVRAKR